MGAPVTRLSRLLSRRVRVGTAAAAAACLAVTFTGAGAAHASPQTAAGQGPSVQSAGMTVQVAPDGGISSVSFADGRVWQLGGRSLLTPGNSTSSADQCTPAGAASATADGGAQWQTTCTDSAGNTTLLTEQLAPADGSVAWTAQVRSESGSYGKGIWTKLTGWSDDHSRQFWTTWGQSSNSADIRGQGPTWSDPLRPAPFTNSSLGYGNGFSVPVFTIVEPGTDHSLSLVQSPADSLLSAAVATDTAGDVQFGRFDNRITPGQPVTFHMNLVPSAGDWRGGLGWMAGHYPDYFKPAMTKLDNELSGLGGYSGYPGPFGDPLRKTLQAEDYKTNWELSLHGPYMGEFMPPVSSPDQQFQSFYHPYLGDPPATVSVNDLRGLEARYADAGFHELGYFNTTEFGAGIQYPSPPRVRQCNDPQVWMNANDYLYCEFSQAMLIGATGKPTGSWEGAVVMDPGDPAYQQHLLDQAKALLTEVPYSGIDIDRLDWVAQFNSHADDGVTWYNGAPARSLVTSWKQLMAKLTPMVHNMGKAVWVSPTAGTTKRIDWTKGIDGFLSEYDDGGAFTNLDAFLGLEKPVEGWNNNLDQTGQPTGPADGPDGLIQRFLYMGVYPMSDAPINNHGINPPSSFNEGYYKDYGPMFKALQGKQWDFTPHAVSVTGGSSLANVFTVPDGAVVPVVQGGTDSSAQVMLRGLAQAKPGIDLTHAQYIQPGGATWQPLPVTVSAAGGVQASVPLSHGAAMIRFLTHAAEQGSTETSGQPVSLNLASSSQWSTQAQPATVTATVTNHSGHAVTGGTASLTNPAGWTVRSLDAAPAQLGPGQSATVRWQVSAPASTAGTVEELTANVTYNDQGGTVPEEDTLRLTSGAPVPQDQVTATATSAQSGQPVSAAVDGDPATFWQSQNGNPQSITLDLGAPRNLSGLTYLARQDGNLPGLTMNYTVSVSADGTRYTPVAGGSWSYDTGLRAASFNARGMRYMRLEISHGVGGLATAAEINAVEAPPGPAQGPVAGPLTPNPILVDPGASATVSSTITNPGSDPASNISAQLHAPAGWTVTPLQAPASIAGGQTAPVSWKLTAPADATPGIYQVSDTIGYDAGGSHWTPSSLTVPVYLGARGPALGAVSPNPIQLSSGAGSATVRTTVTNTGSDPATNVATQLQAPTGWTVTPVDTAPSDIAGGGQTVPVSWQLTPPASTAPGNYQAKISASYDSGGQHWSTNTTVPILFDVVPQNQMSATATSAQSTQYAPAKAVDGNPGTLWHTEWTPTQAYPPQSITLNLGASYDVSGLAYLPRQDGSINGIITGYNIYVSSDGTNFTRVGSGNWPLDASQKAASFTASNIRYLRLEGVQAGNNFVSAAEINVFGQPTAGTG